MSGVFENGYSPTFRKKSLVRMPIRLGDDAFTHGLISDSKITQLVKIMKWSGIQRIYAPQVGLADGIVHILYNKYKAPRNDESSNAV